MTAKRRGLRPCVEPGCHELATSARCPRHALPGHGRDHRRASGHLVGAALCAICHRPFTVDDPMERGHVVAQEDGGLNVPSNYQPEHRSCNRAKPR